MSRETSGVGEFKSDLIKIFILLLSTRRELASFLNNGVQPYMFNPVRSNPLLSDDQGCRNRRGQGGGLQFLWDQLILSQPRGVLLHYNPPPPDFRTSDIPDASLVSGREWVWNAWEFFRFSNIARWGILPLFCSIREKFILTKYLLKWFSWFRCF